MEWREHISITSIIHPNFLARIDRQPHWGIIFIHHLHWFIHSIFLMDFLEFMQHFRYFFVCRALLFESNMTSSRALIVESSSLFAVHIICVHKARFLYVPCDAVADDDDNGDLSLNDINAQMERSMFVERLIGIRYFYCRECTALTTLPRQYSSVPQHVTKTQWLWFLYYFQPQHRTQRKYTHTNPGSFHAAQM